MNNRTGFTLIELLVVIAIIGILIGIAQPILTVCASRTYEHQCESHLLQVGLAMNAYAQDNGRFPARLIGIDGLLQDQSLLDCPKTSRMYYYACPEQEAARDTVIAACVNPESHAGDLPHRFGSTCLILTAGGRVKRLTK